MSLPLLVARGVRKERRGSLDKTVHRGKEERGTKIDDIFKINNNKQVVNR